MPADLTLQIDLAVRLVLASALGAAIGLEREIHEHPAGMRTHLLVALGSAVFTELSIFGFIGVLGPGQGTAPDPTRIAAQVVSGIGFLGAGAIIKYGTFIRGLTTAASLWATAALGLAVGAGEYIIGAIGTAIVIFSLWPLNRVADRLHGRGTHIVRMVLTLERLDALGEISNALASHRIEMAGIESQRLGKGRYEVVLDLRVRSESSLGLAVQTLSKTPGVEIVESGQGE